MTIISQVCVALFFHLIDILSGVISAVKYKNLNSAKMRDGMFKKVGFILCYVLAIAIDKYGYMIGFNLSFSILPVIIGYAVMTEIVSILENVNKINPDLKISKLKTLFQVKDDNDGNETK